MASSQIFLIIKIKLYINYKQDRLKKICYFLVYTDWRKYDDQAFNWMITADKNYKRLRKYTWLGILMIFIIFNKLKMKRISFLLLGLIVGWVFSQTDMEWVNAIMSAPSNMALLQSMLMNTGKGGNDLGQMDAWDKDANTKYVVISIPGIPFQQGMWFPKQWNQENMEIIRIALGDLAAQAGIYGVKGNTHIPSEDQQPITAGNIIGFIFYGLLLLTCLFGVVVEYTDLFGRPKCEGYEELNDNAKDKELVKSKGFIGKFFLAFSFSRNLRKTFFTPQSDKDYLSVMNGIRVLSMAYIILGHVHEILQGLPLTNILSLGSLMQTFYIVIVSGGFYSVDVFFFMSAFLGAYLMILKFDGKKFGLLHFPMIYFHRFFRLVPSILLFLWFIMSFYLYFGYGPIWMMLKDVLIVPCQKWWWTTILFINNMYPKEGEIKCHNVLWYLANDMQFFIILPFLVLAYLRNRMIGYSLVLFLLFGNIVCTFLISIIDHHPMTMFIDPLSHYIYHVPYTRIGAYLVGVLFGIFYFEFQKSQRDPAYKATIGSMLYTKIQSNRILRWSLYLICSIIMIFFICIPYAETHNFPQRDIGDVPSAFFNSLHRILFCIALALWMAGPATGKTPLFRFIFGGSAWAPWAKVSFMAYLSHIYVVAFYYLQTYQGVYLTTRWAMYAFFACAL